MQFVHEEVVETIYEDYLYVFVEPMLKSLEDVPVLDDENMFGENRCMAKNIIILKESIKSITRRK